MQQAIRIPAKALVLVADARKALFISNAGNAIEPQLQIDKVLEAAANPPTHAQGVDRPGRVAMGSHRSAVDQTDWHEQGEAQFAELVMETLAGQSARALILVAAPAFLAELRHRMPQQMKERVLAEIPKDLTHLPLRDIEAHLVERK
jgi:protein required for attachment to host cells